MQIKYKTIDENSKRIHIFEYSTYKTAVNKREYIYDLILFALQKKKIMQPLLCMNQLTQIINSINIPLKPHQMSQLYLYSTYDRYQNLGDTKKKILAILNQQKKRINFKSVAQWIHQKLENKQINLVPNRAKSVAKEKKELKETQRLPSIIGTSTQKLTEELRYLIEIFQEMQKERQDSGLIPIVDDNQDNQTNQVQVPHTNIPYDPELYFLNNKLSKLKIKAQDRLARIVDLAKDDARIRKMLQQAIERFQQARIDANQRIGKVGAIKAQKRLQQFKHRQQKKIRHLSLGESEDLVHATRLYALLTLPQLKSNRIIL